MNYLLTNKTLKLLDHYLLWSPELIRACHRLEDFSQRLAEMLASLKIQKSQLSDENFISLVTKDKMSTVSTWLFHMVILIVGLKIRYICFLTKEETSTWAQTKSFKIIQVLIDPETTLIWYFGVRVKLRLCIHLSLMANESQNASPPFQIQAESGFSSKP